MKNKTILILGGSGALGKTLLSRYHEKNTIIVFSRDEHKHVRLMKKYPDIAFQIGDVKDKDSIIQAINEYKPDIIINAAALKHVPICESNVFESVKTNIVGHQNLIDAVSLSNHQIETLIFISTDKACKPINVYGMCKAISERLYVNFSEKQNDIKVVIVRYGNVLESTESVIPFFKKLLDSKCEHLPITHLEMTRFLLTLNSAVNLIEWAYFCEEAHGNVVVPKVKSLKIVDLAKELAESYGRNISLKVVGIRPGEKLHEEMVSHEESIRTRDMGEYFIVTNNIFHNDSWSYSSDSNLIPVTEVKNFLIDSGVIE